MYHNQWNERKGTIAALVAGMVMFSLASPSRALDPAVKCQEEVAAAGAKFESSRLKALQKCEDHKRKGKLPATTDCLTETKAADAISKAQAKLSADIAKFCGTQTLTAIGWDGSGNAGNPVLAKQCSAGKNIGSGCLRETECGGICVGGGKDANSCTFNSSCGNRICVKANCIGGGALDHTDCSSLAAATACEAAGGICNWGQGCDGGSASALGTCAGGTKSQATCAANSDCTGTGSCVSGKCDNYTNVSGGKTCSTSTDCPAFCDSGCNTGSLLDCQAGVCQGAMCSSAKDCGLCQPGTPNQQQSCAADTDCGKLCVGGSQAGAACKAAGDCPGGSCSAVSGGCVVGTCSGGFCSSNSGLALAGDARPSSGLCLPADRCPGFENNKFQTAKSCDGGSNNGQSCTANSDCIGVCVGGTCASGANHNLSCTTDSDCQACKNGCDFALASTTDLANCLTCVGNASVDQFNRAVYGKMKPAAYLCVNGANAGLPCTPATAATDCPAPGVCKANANDKDLEKCKQGIGKAAAKFFADKRKFLAICEKGVLGGKITGPCPDAKAAEKIATAATKLSDKVTKSCPDSPLPDSIGNLFNCANLTAPGAATSCAGISGLGPITTLADLTACVQCLADFKVGCADRMAAPGTGGMYPECNPLCGNGKIDGHCSVTTSTTCGSTLDCPTGESCVPIETCDDGNSVSGDTCPSNCVIQSCTPSGTHPSIEIDVTAPPGVSLAGLSVYVEYPDGTVEIPGHANDANVQASLTIPFDAFGSINDLDYAVRIALVANSPATVPSPAAVVQLNQCTGASTPTSDMFRCSVESAADTNGNTVSGVSCSVTVH